MAKDGMVPETYELNGDLRDAKMSATMPTHVNAKTNRRPDDSKVPTKLKRAIIAIAMGA
jgi:hypothetical protein